MILPEEITYKKARSMLDTFHVVFQLRVTMSKLQDKLEIMLSQYGLVKTMASITNGRDLFYLGKSCRRNWTAIFPNLRVLTKIASFGIKCDGTGPR